MLAVTLQDVFEGRTKIPIESGVDDRVEEAVGVAEPEEQAVEPVRYADVGLFAERLDEGEYEEGQPAGGEGAHDDAKRLGRLALV